MSPRPEESQEQRLVGLGNELDGFLVRICERVVMRHVTRKVLKDRQEQRNVRRLKELITAYFVREDDDG